MDCFEVLPEHLRGWSEEDHEYLRVQTTFGARRGGGGGQTILFTVLVDKVPIPAFA
jgi:hypothetical protein